MTKWQASDGFSDYGHFGRVKGRRGAWNLQQAPVSPWGAKLSSMAFFQI